MSCDLYYNYIDRYEFGLNVGPFTLNILITNFIDNRNLKIQYIAQNYSLLPKTISDFINKQLSDTQYNEFKEFISGLDPNSYLHFEVNLHNKIEHIHKQYLTKKISEIYKN